MSDLRIGILGGTFDPPHYGHLALGERVCDELALQRLLFAPAAQPPHKLEQPLTPARERVAMLRRALAGNRRFSLSRVDLDRPGPHYALDTVRLSGEGHPEATLWFVMGADSLRDLPAWHQPQELLTRCRLAVAPRPGVEAWPGMHAQTLPQLEARVTMIAMPPLGIASSDIAARLRAGRSVRYLLPDEVLDCIRERGLYRA